MGSDRERVRKKERESHTDTSRKGINMKKTTTLFWTMITIKIKTERT